MQLSDYRTLASDHGFGDLAFSVVDRETNFALQDVCRRERWPWLERATTAATVAGTQTLTLPADFDDLIALTIPTVGVVLEPIRLDDYQHLIAGDDTDQNIPAYYVFIGGGSTGAAPALRLWPIPDAIYTLALDYRAVPATLALTTDTPGMPSQYHEVVGLGMLTRLHRMEDNPGMANFYANELDKQLALLKEAAFTQQSDRTEYIHVVDSYVDDLID